MGCVDKGLADKWGLRLFKGSNKCTTQLKQASNKDQTFDGNEILVKSKASHEIHVIQ